MGSETGGKDYRSIVGPELRNLCENQLNNKSQASMAVFIQMTKHVMEKYATATNDVSSSKPSFQSTSMRVPFIIRQKRNALKRAGQIKCPNKRNEAVKKARANYRSAVRRLRLKQNNRNVDKLSNILHANPSKAYNFLKSCRQQSTVTLDHLVVGDEVFAGEDVPYGFFKSMSKVKKCNINELKQV